MKHFNITVKGRVQGVFYRATAKEKADQWNLTGFARNEPGGSVYMEVEGEGEGLKQFLRWIHEGPEMANVNNVTLERGELQNYKEFRIVH